MKIDASSQNGKVLYTIEVSKKKVTVECNDDNTFRIQGPKEIMFKAIGGRGEENATEAWITDKDCSCMSVAVSSVLEVIKTMNE